MSRSCVAAIGPTVLLTLLVAGCSVLLRTAEPNQCSTNLDCDANSALRQRVCEEGFCVVPRAAGPVPTASPADGCVSSEICTQANSNKASVCATVGGACTPWQTAQCPYLSGDWKNRNAVVLGSIHPFSVKQSDGRLVKVDYAQRVRKAIDLALDDFTTALPGGLIIPGGAPRPLAVLHCDSYLDPALAQAAMTHLTDVVGVKAVIVGGDDDLVSVSAQALARQTALVCSDCVAPFPPGAPPWRIVPPLALQAPMAAWRVASLENELRARPNPPPAFNVGLLVEVGRPVSAFVSALTESVRFNGKSAAENGANFTVIKSESPLKGSVDYLTHAKALASAAPDVIVVAMGAEFPSNYLKIIEAAWPAGKPKPHYVVTERNFEVTPFADVLGPGDEDLRRRISGTRSGYDPRLQDNIDAYTPHYRVENNGHSPDVNYSGYDAFYALAFAVAAASSQLPLNGPHISSAFELLRGGSVQVDFRPGQIGFALTWLGQSTSSSVDVRGLWSTLDWNVSTHDLASDVSMFCFQRAPDGSLVIKLDAGPRLVTSTGVVSHAYACD